MSESAKERRRALLFFAGLSVALVVVAVISLVAPQPVATPGVTVTAILLLLGAGYGAVASSVALMRGRRAAAAEPAADAAADADSAVE
jgi:hypothetical protein